jgi:hypothetical protein
MESSQKIQIKEELFQLIRKLERNFNDEDERRFKELRAQYLQDSDFFREWMVYDRLVVLSMIENHKGLKEMYHEIQAEYVSVKYAAEDTEFYQNELKAWKDVNGIK